MPAAGSIVAASPGSCSVARSATGGMARSPPGCTAARETPNTGSTVVAEMAGKRVVVAREIIVVPVEMQIVVVVAGMAVVAYISR